MILGFLQNVGPWQLVIVLVIAFVLFGGASKIGDIARSLGKAKSEFKKGIAEGEKDDPEIPKDDEKAEAKDEPAKELV